MKLITVSGKPIEMSKVKEEKIKKITESAFSEIPYISDYIFDMKASKPNQIMVDKDDESVSIIFEMKDDVPLLKVYNMIKTIIETGADSWMEGDIIIYDDEELTFKTKKLIKLK